MCLWKIKFNLFKFIHSATSTVIMAGPGSSYSTLYQEGRLYLFFPNPKHSFSGWCTVFLQFGHRCFSFFIEWWGLPVVLLQTASLTSSRQWYVWVPCLFVFVALVVWCKERWFCGQFKLWRGLLLTTLRLAVILPVPWCSHDTPLLPRLLAFQLHRLCLSLWRRGWH